MGIAIFTGLNHSFHGARWLLIIDYFLKNFLHKNAAKIHVISFRTLFVNLALNCCSTLISNLSATFFIILSFYYFLLTWRSFKKTFWVREKLAKTWLFSYFWDALGWHKHTNKLNMVGLTFLVLQGSIMHLSFHPNLSCAIW